MSTLHHAYKIHPTSLAKQESEMITFYNQNKKVVDVVEQMCNYGTFLCSFEYLYKNKNNSSVRNGDYWEIELIPEHSPNTKKNLQLHRS